jgi:hypothetical protein
MNMKVIGFAGTIIIAQGIFYRSRTIVNAVNKVVVLKRLERTKYS